MIHHYLLIFQQNHDVIMIKFSKSNSLLLEHEFNYYVISMHLPY